MAEETVQETETVEATEAQISAESETEPQQNGPPQPFCICRISPWRLGSADDRVHSVRRRCNVHCGHTFRIAPRNARFAKSQEWKFSSVRSPTSEGRRQSARPWFARG